MSPSQGPSTRQRKQLPYKRRQSRQRSRQPRSRACLLKGCEKRFRPTPPMARYCSEGCREKARRWSQWKSRQRWRRSENGRKKRREQSVRHRERLRRSGRVRSRPEGGARGSSQGASANFFFVNTCDRPGCYERFERTRRSPLQRFCSHDCRRALERVLERERRWKKRGQARIAGAKSLAAQVRVTAAMRRSRTSGHIAKAKTFS
jgi:predicted nucleic acid-binding Zn ribbon protein